MCSFDCMSFPSKTEFHPHHGLWVAQKSLPAVQEIRVQSVGQEDPLEKGMATHSGILA